MIALPCRCHIARARTLRLLALLAVAACGQWNALAQSTAIVEKQHKSVQTRPTTVVDDSATSDGIWRFSASVATTATGAISYTPPGGTAQPLPLDTANGAYDVHVGFSGQNGLNTNYPNGTYLLTFNGQTTAVALTGDTYPNVPVATTSAGRWSNGTLFVNPAIPDPQINLQLASTGATLASNARLGGRSADHSRRCRDRRLYPDQSVELGFGGPAVPATRRLHRPGDERVVRGRIRPRRGV